MYWSTVDSFEKSSQVYEGANRQESAPVVEEECFILSAADTEAKQQHADKKRTAVLIILK